MNQSATRSIVADPIVGRAVSAIVPNSDKQLDPNTLEQTFVDMGIITQLGGSNSQIVFGRRGTGKSHLLRLLSVRQSRQPTEAAVFVDVRSLGSAQLMTDRAKPLTTRVVSVFRDLLGELQSRLLDLSTDPQQPERIDALESVSALAESIAAISTTVNNRDITAETDTSTEQSTGVSATISQMPSLNVGRSSQADKSTKFIERYTEVFIDTLVFSNISMAIGRAIETLGITRLSLAIDEWSSIPEDIQPYVAEFLKRTVFPCSRIAVKIGSLAYRSAFSIQLEGAGRIGLEFGGEITRNVDLDEHFTFERDPALAANTFSELLWQHLAGNMNPKDYLQSQYGVSDARQLRTAIFSDDDAFAELLKAASGVARDFLSIFASAYFRSAIARSNVINASSVRNAAVASFQTEKLLNLDEEQKRTLRTIAQELHRRSADEYFLLDQEFLSNPMIHSLFDMRVIHVVERYYTGVTQLNRPYTLYVLDYGASLAMGLPVEQPEVRSRQRMPGRDSQEGSRLPVPDLSPVLHLGETSSDEG